MSAAVETVGRELAAVREQLAKCRAERERLRHIIAGLVPQEQMLSRMLAAAERAQRAHPELNGDES